MTRTRVPARLRPRLRPLALLLLAALLSCDGDGTTAPSIGELELTVDRASAAVGEAVVITVRVRDTDGDPIDASADRVTLATTHGTLGSVARQGAGRFVVSLSAATPGTATVTGRFDETPFPAAVTVQFGAGPVAGDRVEISVSPASARAGDSVRVTVRLRDRGGNPAGGGARVALTTTLGTAGPVSDQGGGTHAAWLRFTTSGIAQIGATVDEVPVAATVLVVVQPGTATRLAFPNPVVRGGEGTLAARVEVKDTFGNTVTAAAPVVTVALGANPSGATLAGATMAPAVEGVAQFGGLTLDRPGSGYTLVATAAGLAPATSAPFDLGNGRPRATNDVYETDEDRRLTVGAPGVLANDRDPDGDPLTATLVRAPQYGTLTLDERGSFTYDPRSAFVGLDSFTYRARAGGRRSDPATVVIQVIAVDDRPRARPDAYGVDEDGVLNVAAPGVLGNDSDPENDALAAQLVSGPSNGMLELRANGSFRYTPSPGFNGADAFTYQASDGNRPSGPAIVTLTVAAVNDAPVANDDAVDTDEDTPRSIDADELLANDVDPDGDPLSVVLASQPLHGTAAVQLDGSVLYTPDADYHGADAFTYRASDGTDDSAPATVTITVSPVNDGPVAVTESYQVDEDDTLVVAAGAGLLANDTDVEGDPLTAQQITGPNDGTLTVNADGSFSYTPNPDFNGADSFTYAVSDGGAADSATVTITVRPVNDAPVAMPDSYVQPYEFVALVVDAASGVLANDYDVDGDDLDLEVVVDPTMGGVSLFGDGSLEYIGPPGTDTFVYRLFDSRGGESFATVTVKMNNEPNAFPDTYTTNEDDTLVIAASSLLANDTDDDDDPLSMFLTGQPRHGTLTPSADSSSFTYVPDQNFFGADTFTYRATDGYAESHTHVRITVTSVNDAPVAVANSYQVDEDSPLLVNTPGLVGNDTDVDGNQFAVSLLADVGHGILNLGSLGQFSYIPHSDFFGVDSFVYRVEDAFGARSDPATVTITVKPVNDAPTIGSVSVSGDEGIPCLQIDLPVMDVDGDVLVLAVVDTPQNGTLRLADGTTPADPDDFPDPVCYTPDSRFFHGTDSFTYTVSDGTVTVGPETVDITINDIN